MPRSHWSLSCISGSSSSRCSSGPSPWAFALSARRPISPKPRRRSRRIRACTTASSRSVSGGVSLSAARGPRSRFSSSAASSSPAYSAVLPRAERFSGCRRSPAPWRSPWYCRRKRAGSAERGDLGEKLLRIDGLDDVVPRSLSHAPNPVGFQFLAGAHDHRDVLGGFVARDGARRLEPVGAGHDDVHQDQVRHLALRLGDALVAVLRSHALVTLLAQHLQQELAVGGRIVDDQDLLDWHGKLSPLNWTGFGTRGADAVRTPGSIRPDAARLLYVLMPQG